MIDVLCRVFRRCPKPVDSVELPEIPRTKELPHSITHAARIRRQAERLFATDRPIERDIFPNQHKRGKSQ